MIARVNRCHRGSNSFNHAGTFVAEDDGEWSSVVLITYDYVGMAYTCRHDSDEHFIGPRIADVCHFYKKRAALLTHNRDFGLAASFVSISDRANACLKFVHLICPIKNSDYMIALTDRDVAVYK